MMETWTDDLPVCKMTGVGFQANQKYKEGGARYEMHSYEDTYFYFQLQEENCSLYALFDGHDSAKVSNFAKQRLPAELLLGQLQGAMTEADVKRLLKQSFESVEKGFFEFIDDVLVQRTNLQIQLPEDMNIYDASQRFPNLIERLNELDKEIAGGATAAVALILYDKIYVANVGDTRVLLCTKDENGILHVEQISCDHNTKSQTELQHLANLGLDIEKIQISGKIGNSETTRSLGDFHVKGGYKEFDLLRAGTKEPVTAEPAIYGGRTIDDSFYFLALMSRGLYRALEESANCVEVNRDVASIVATELKEQTTIEGVAQAVVDKICRIHQDEFVRSSGHICQQREDMTLLLRLFGAKLGGKIQTPVTPTNLVQSVSPAESTVQQFAVTVPYDTSKLSVQDFKLPPLTVPKISGSSSLPSSRVTTPISPGSTSTPPVYLQNSKPRFESMLLKAVCKKTSYNVSSFQTPPTVTMASSGFQPRCTSPFSQTLVTSPGGAESTGSTGTPENPSSSSSSTPTGLSSLTSEEQEYPVTTQKAEGTDGNPMPDLVQKIEIPKSDKKGYPSKGTKKGMSKQDQMESMMQQADKTGVLNPGPKSLELGQDGRVDPYVDFTDFFERVALDGGEATVFAEFF